ncbi:MAG: hypothetical protein E6579_03440 [Clostridium sp.]|nr:hypothetical protein [Clostridium sp.]
MKNKALGGKHRPGPAVRYRRHALDGLASRLAAELHVSQTSAAATMANLMMQNCVSPFIVGKHQLLAGLRPISKKTQKSKAFSDQNRDVPCS